MKLINKYKYPNSKMNEYFCDITSELDKLAGINSSPHRKHYVLADNYCIGNKCLPIRIPGGTLGEIAFDDDNTITRICVDTDYVVKTYPADVNENIQKFIGQKIEF